MSFSARILTWFDEHGRHDLPWQQFGKSVPDPYPVWVSEIMLQQTQVATVIGYFHRFMARFPTLDALADAPLDDVLEHWAGLGYYARARNLHKTAKALQKILKETNTYPTTLDEWQALSGIGRSTAGAILAMGMGQFGVICDGNVKRVLTRHFGIADDITKPATDKILWELATNLTPKDNSGRYAQAMMDMGATLCTRTRPHCTACPVADTCMAYQEGEPTAYPVKAKKSAKPTHHSFVLLLNYHNQYLWLKRPTDGIWGGLWCLPLLSETLAVGFAESLVVDCLGLDSQNLTAKQSIRHTLTHFHWQLSPIIYTPSKKQVEQLTALLTDVNAQFGWHGLDNPLAKPTAMQKILGLINDGDFAPN